MTAGGEGDERMSLAQLSESLVVSRRVQPSLPSPLSSVRLEENCSVRPFIHTSVHSTSLLQPLRVIPPSLRQSVLPHVHQLLSVKEICCLGGRKNAAALVLQSTRGQQARRFKRALGAAAAPPAVCGGTPRIGGPSRPAARPPPCPGSAGSCAAPGWRRHPTGNHRGRIPMD